MTLQEFKAWFEGYTEALNGAPNVEQFERIKAQVAKITGTPTTYPVFVDRYWRGGYNPVWSSTLLVGSPTVTQVYQDAAHGQNDFQNGSGSYRQSFSADFDSISAMYALGKTEAAH